MPGERRAEQRGVCDDEKGGTNLEKGKGYTVTNAGAQVVQPVHKQPAGAANQVTRGTDLRTGRTGKK